MCLLLNVTQEESFFFGQGRASSFWTLWHDGHCNLAKTHFHSEKPRSSQLERLCPVAIGMIPPSSWQMPLWKKASYLKDKHAVLGQLPEPRAQLPRAQGHSSLGPCSHQHCLVKIAAAWGGTGEHSILVSVRATEHTEAALGPCLPLVRLVNPWSASFILLRLGFPFHKAVLAILTSCHCHRVKQGHAYIEPQRRETAAGR